MRNWKKWLVLSALAAQAPACAVDDGGDGVRDDALGAVSCDYPQPFGTSAKTGKGCASSLVGMQVVKTIVQDQDADAINEAFGYLQEHEGAPLTSGDYVVIPSHRGFTGRTTRSTDVWYVQGFKWVPSVSAPNAVLTPLWSTDTTWQPTDSIISTGPGSHTNAYAPALNGVIAGAFVYVPARAGKLLKINLATGAIAATINPFAGTKYDNYDRAITVGQPSLAALGTRIYYTVSAFDQTSTSRSTEPYESWLVSVALPQGIAQITPWSALTAVAGVPGSNDPCEYPFGTSGTPGPTGPDSRAPTFGCGVQRPSFGAAVAENPANGHLVAFSHANNALGAAFLLEIDPAAPGTQATPQTIRAMDTRGYARHGCGVRLPIAGACSVITAGGTTNLGFDPDFNGPVRFRSIDLVDSSPTVAPNGDMAIGSYDGGTTFGGGYDARGFGLAFRASDGHVVGVNQAFWWELTPAVLPHGNTFSYLGDLQRFSDGDLRVAQLSPAFAIENSGTVPADPSAVAIDFLDAQTPFDASGVRYAVNGDGHLYQFGANGALVDAVALTNADGSVRSMETLAGFHARDAAGRIYASYAGNVYVIAGGGAVAKQPAHTLGAAVNRAIAGAAKRAALQAVTSVEPPERR